MSRQRVALWAFLVAIGGVAVLASIQYASASRHSREIEPTQDGLLITSRDRLAVCAQGIDGVTLRPDDARAHLSTAFSALANDPAWGGGGFDRAPAVVEAGCPEPPVILRPGVQAERNRRRIPGSLLTDAPSRFLVFVFVSSQSLIDRTFLGDPAFARTEIEQIYCFGASGPSSCLAVTKGLYLTAEEFRDRTELSVALGNAIGLPCTPCRVLPPSGGAEAKPIAPSTPGGIPSPGTRP
jgi:hypothetical protein